MLQHVYQVIEKPIFQLFFLKNDGDETVEVLEVQEIDFTLVKKHLEYGESVFISLKPKSNIRSRTTITQEEDENEPWFFNHI